MSPASKISIIRQVGGNRLVSDATWWLILDPATGKPTRYTSFNSRSDKLNVPKAFAFRPYRQSRCVIPVSAFVEGLGDGSTYHMVELIDQAIMLGGLYREYLVPDTGEIVLGCSIITLGALPAWRHFHPDSMPLILPVEKSLIDAWLDPAVTDVEQFDQLLQARVGAVQRVTPIDRPSTWSAVGDPFLICP